MNSRRALRILVLGAAIALVILAAGGLATAGNESGAANRAKAIAALALHDGDCVNTANILRPRLDVSRLVAQADALGGPGRIDGVFFGTSSELAADTAGQIVAEGTGGVWILTTGAGGTRSVALYEEYVLKSSRSAWVGGARIGTVDCEDAAED